MLGLLFSLVEPVSKVLLKAWLGDASAEIGGGLVKYALDVLKDRGKATSAAKQALKIAEELVRNIETSIDREGITGDVLEPAKIELALTLNQHLDTGVLIGGALKPPDVEKALLAARPVDSIFKSGEPERNAYLMLVRLIAPRLCALAPSLPDYAKERDTVLLSQMFETTQNAQEILQNVHEIGREVSDIRSDLREIGNREARQKAIYEGEYRRAVVNALDYVEILGLPDLGRESRESKLSVAYLSLTTNTSGIGQRSFGDLLDLLPLLGGRLLIEGPAGSGKSTLLRWTAIQAATGDSTDLGVSFFRHWSPSFLNIFPWSTYKDELSKLSWFPDPLEDKFAFFNCRPALSIFKSGIQPIKDQFPLMRPTIIPQSLGWLKEGDDPDASQKNLVQQVMEKFGAINANWRRTAPFQIRLRHLEGGLPAPEDLPAHLSSALGKPPEGWVRDQLAEGRAMLLIDGVDEVPEGAQREAALNGIRDYAHIYDKCLLIVASRPAAVDRKFFSDLGFVFAGINELSTKQRDAFIDNWHRAFATNIRRSPDDVELTNIASELKTALRLQPHLALLATNPLLCAGICALHERNRNALPKSEWDLCAKLTEMLADQRDRSSSERQRPLRLEAFPPAYNLSYPVRRSVLARLADAMVSQQLSALPRSEAIEHVMAMLGGLKDAEGLTADTLLDALIARSGVLRAASIARPPDEVQRRAGSTDAIEFSHNTLKAWLASLYCLELNKPAELAAKPLASELAQVIVFAAGAPTHKSYTENLIKALLDRSARQSDPVERRNTEIVALRCDASAPNLDPALREVLARTADNLFPPKTFEEAQQLAVLGSAAVPRLAVANPSIPEAAACIRCLRLIASDSARRALIDYRGSENPNALEELAQIYDPLILPSIVKAIQDFKLWAQVPKSIKERIEDLVAIKSIPYLKHVFLSDTKIKNLSDLSSHSLLRQLDISRTPVSDISTISAFADLESLNLDDTSVSSLEPVVKLPKLGILYLNGVDADLSPLQRCGSLWSLRVGGTASVDMSQISALTNLTSLLIDGDWVTDLTSLATLTQLRFLAIANTKVSDLTPLAELHGLKWLYFYRAMISDLTPLAGLEDLEALGISGTLVESLEPIIHLAKLRHLRISGTPLSTEEIGRFVAADPTRTVEGTPSTRAIEAAHLSDETGLLNSAEESHGGIAG